MLEIGRFTPLYGYAGLARYPISEGHLPNDAGHDPVWLLLANVSAWTVIFAAAGGVGTAPSSGAGVTAVQHVAGPAQQPLGAVGLGVAGVWLVFLVYPVIETLEADASAPTKAPGAGADRGVRGDLPARLERLARARAGDLVRAAAALASRRCR